MGQGSSSFGRDSHAQVIVVGLDNAGKTTLLRHLRANRKLRHPDTDVAPTVGVNRELLRLPEHRLSITAFDMSGHCRYRNLWEHMMSDRVSGIVFVVDSSDPMRFVVARDELDSLLKHPSVCKPPPLPILFLANKSDLPTAAGPATVAQKMALEKLPTSVGSWHICATNGLTGEGVQAAFGWMAIEISKMPKTRKR